METVYLYCQTCRETTPWNVTKVTPRQSNENEAIIALRCIKCKKVTLRKVDQGENEKDE